MYPPPVLLPFPALGQSVRRWHAKGACAILKDENKDIKIKMHIIFLSRVSTLALDIDIAIICLSVCLSNVPVLKENGLTYCHSFFNHTVAQPF